ncbi:TonB-dependent receptor plug domain-containing protein [Stenotrophomonas ginsengisoli]|uniref:TonB-dependent receptor plug domain-containing protein n=1 Tax=Stenotrophomonas ginsengisoli TaxID=336566 RepID=UPI000AD41653|nr:TonB-dependent receptor [Stenotrophomonas ginsengisoli]
MRSEVCPLAAGIAVALFCLSPAAQAQATTDVAPAPATSAAQAVAADAGSDAATLDSVVVTGSRIARPELVTPMPISVVRMDEALRFGATDAYSALAQNPAIGVGTSLASGPSGWDSGIASINLRNMGTNRTLTLIDGKRRVSASARSSAVDISTIPLGMIERVEVVTGGAAAVYGADAVTGAVNIITKKDIEQTTLSASAGLSERGDAQHHTLSAATGFKFAEGRGRVSLGATYAQNDALYRGDRFDWRDQPMTLPNPANTGAADGIPDRAHVWNYRQHYYAYEPNFWLADEKTRYMLTDGGSIRPMVYDIYLDKAPSQFSLGSGGDGRNLTDMHQLLGGNESTSVMGRVDFDINDNLYYGAWFNYARSNYDGAGTYYRDDTRTTFMGVGSAKAYLDNPFLPDSIRQLMLDKGLSALSIDRTYGNFPVRSEEHHRKTLTVGSELGGRFSDYVGWNVFAQYGEVTDHAVQGNVPVKSRWLAARDVTTGANGLPVCRDEAARAAGCIPLNIFSTEKPSRELLDWVLDDRDEHRTTTQLVAGAEVSGTAFTLPAGSLGFALGAEYRKETLKNSDDPLALSGELVYGGGPGARSQLDEGYEVGEVFGELLVPVLADKAFARRVDLELAYRYSDYTTVGATDAWKAGLIWEPIEGLAIRGVRSRSVRTPNFGELYEPVFTSTTTGSITDPCEAGDYHASPTRAANCLALGVTTPLPDIKTGPHITTGGNPDLAPETSDSLTIGFVWQPSFLRNFDLTVDYWDIDITDVITQISYTNILRLCVDLPSINNPYCAAHGRNQTPDVPTSEHGITLPAGAPLWVKAQQANVSRLYARGIDVGANYHVDIGPGRLGLRFTGTWLRDNVTETTPGIASGNVVSDGSYTNPHFRATLATSYDLENWGIALNTRHHGAGKADVNATSAEQYDNNDVPSRTYYDLSLRYRLGKGQTLNLAVQNLGDTLPPYMGFGEPGIYANNTVYDVVGRSYSLSWNWTF